MANLAGSSSQIDLPDAKPFGDIQSAVEEAIESFDRAQHAEASERSAQNDLGRKTEELQRMTAQVQDATVRRERLAKAEEVLRGIKQDYSLEDATRDALASIREQVGSTPIPRTLPSKLTMSREECHGTTKKVQCGVQA